MKINKTNSEKFNVLGIDVGGTFTDLIYVNKKNNVIEFAKVSTSSENTGVPKKIINKNILIRFFSCLRNNFFILKF